MREQEDTTEEVRQGDKNSAKKDNSQRSGGSKVRSKNDGHGRPDT
jgi:hypothetical protein